MWPRKGSLMKTQTWILDNRLYYTRKIELHRKGVKSRTVRITPILICLRPRNLSVQITVRRVHYGKMGKAPTTSLPHVFYFVEVLLIFFSFWVDHQRVGEFPFSPWPTYFRCWLERIKIEHVENGVYWLFFCLWYVVGVVQTAFLKLVLVSLMCVFGSFYNAHHITNSFFNYSTFPTGRVILIFFKVNFFSRVEPFFRR